MSEESLIATIQETTEAARLTAEKIEALIQAKAQQHASGSTGFFLAPNSDLNIVGKKLKEVESGASGLMQTLGIMPAPTAAAASFGFGRSSTPEEEQHTAAAT